MGELARKVMGNKMLMRTRYLPVCVVGALIFILGLDLVKEVRVVVGTSEDGS